MLIWIDWLQSGVEAAGVADGMSLLHPFYLLGYCLSLAATHSTLPTLSRSHSTGIMSVVFLLRSIGCVSLASLAVPLRPALIYVAGLTGVIIAKFTEASLLQPDVINSSETGRRVVNHEARLLAARRRRTSSSALTASATSATSGSSAASGASGASAGADGSKARRTSLPALLANKNQFAILVSAPFPHVYLWIRPIWGIAIKVDCNGS